MCKKACKRNLSVWITTAVGALVRLFTHCRLRCPKNTAELCFFLIFFDRCPALIVRFISHRKRSQTHTLLVPENTYKTRKTYTIRYMSFMFGVPGGTRTPDPLVRSQILYPAELQIHNYKAVLISHNIIPQESKKIKP